MTQRNHNIICCNECNAPLTDTELEVYPLQWQHSGDMYCSQHETREQFKQQKEQTVPCGNPTCSETCLAEVDEFSILDDDNKQFCCDECYIEVHGDNDWCDCDICIDTSEIAVSTSDLDYIDGYRRGRSGYASSHGMSISHCILLCWDIHILWNNQQLQVAENRSCMGMLLERKSISKAKECVA